MVELKDNRVGFATIDARVGEQVLPDVKPVGAEAPRLLPHDVLNILRLVRHVVSAVVQTLAQTAVDLLRGNS